MGGFSSNENLVSLKNTQIQTRFKENLDHSTGKKNFQAEGVATENYILNSPEKNKEHTPQKNADFI